jgi:hypothetical protein
MDEVELFKSAETRARADIRDTLSTVRQDMAAAVSPRGWVRERPVGSLLVAGGLSLAVGFGAARKTKRLLAARGRTPPAARDGGPGARAASTAGGERRARRRRWARWVLVALREAPLFALGILRRLLRQASPGLQETPATASAGTSGADLDRGLFSSAVAPGAGPREE